MSYSWRWSTASHRRWHRRSSRRGAGLVIDIAADFRVADACTLRPVLRRPSVSRAAVAIPLWPGRRRGCPPARCHGDRGPGLLRHGGATGALSARRNRRDRARALRRDRLEWCRRTAAAHHASSGAGPQPLCLLRHGTPARGGGPFELASLDRPRRCHREADDAQRALRPGYTPDAPCEGGMAARQQAAGAVSERLCGDGHSCGYSTSRRNSRTSWAPTRRTSMRSDRPMGGRSR